MNGVFNGIPALTNKGSVYQLDEEIEKINALKLPAVIFFGIPNYEDVTGSAALQAECVVQRITMQAPQRIV